MKINAQGLDYQQLNGLIHQAASDGQRDIIVDNVNGQRYIGTGLSGNLKITIQGVPGNDLAAFMDGPTIIVNSNGQDGIGNTMNAGKIVIHGNVGDIAGHSMRGGKIYIKGNAGYRTGIHMKSYKDLYPVIIIGGRAGRFLGEYMAGGLIVVLGMGQNKDEPCAGSYLGTGMHGGKIYIRGKLNNYQLGKEANILKIDKDDQKQLFLYLEEYCRDFDIDFKEIQRANFVKLIPSALRPYERLYAY